MVFRNLAPFLRSVWDTKLESGANGDGSFDNCAWAGLLAGVEGGSGSAAVVQGFGAWGRWEPLTVGMKICVHVPDKTKQWQQLEI